MNFSNLDSTKHPQIRRIKDLRANSLNEFTLEDSNNSNNINWLLDSNNSAYSLQYIISSCEEKLYYYNQHYKIPKVQLYYTKPSILHTITVNNRINTIALVTHSLASNQEFLKDEQLNNKNQNLVILMDNLQDHGNVGTIIRNSFMMGVNNFIFFHQFHCFYPKIIEASRGLVFHCNIILAFDVEKINVLIRKYSSKLILSIANTTTIGNIGGVDLLGSYPILVMGNETYGFSQPWEQNNYLNLSIPMRCIKQCDSLNVATCCGILVSSIKQLM